MLRFFNRVSKMDDDRWPKVIYKLDASLGLNTWVSEIKYIAAILGLPTTWQDGHEFDLEFVYNTLLLKSRHRWQLEASRKPKLRTFLEIHKFEDIQTLVKSNLSRYQRSLLAQLKFGILPLKIETDRYQGIALNERICKLCNLNAVEDTYHFMFRCPALQITRERAAIQLNLNVMMTNNDSDMLSILLDKSNISTCGKYIEKLYKERQKIMYT